jgi:hypothetical protein
MQIAAALRKRLRLSAIVRSLVSSIQNTCPAFMPEVVGSAFVRRRLGVF